MLIFIGMDGKFLLEKMCGFLRVFGISISKRRRDFPSLTPSQRLEFKDPSWEFFSSKKDFWFLHKGQNPECYTVGYDRPQSTRGFSPGPLWGGLRTSSGSCRKFCRTHSSSCTTLYYITYIYIYLYIWGAQDPQGSAGSCRTGTSA